MLADMGGAFQHSGPAALTADFHQTEGGYFAHLNAGTVVLQGVLQLLFDRSIILGLIHVDEVDDDQAGQVTQTQLARGLFRRLHIRLQRGGFDIPFAGCAAGVDVDRHQGLGLVDHQIAAGAQGHGGGVDLA